LDVGAVSETVAELVATGAVKEVGAQAAKGVVRKIVERVRAVFGGDRRSVEALDRACEEPSPQRVGELAAALRWYAERDAGFAAELEQWAAMAASHSTVDQEVHAGRDAYVAGRDQSVVHHYRPED
jgi:hypothetical protein